MGWIFPIAIVILWQLASGLGLIQAEWLPSPLTIAKTLFELGRTGELWGHIGVTTLRVLVGFLIGAAAGTVAGAVTTVASVVSYIMSEGMVDAAAVGAAKDK